MTLQKDQDPGWWRRGMSSRGITIVVAVCVTIVVVGIIVAIAMGYSFF
ncbi:hypothetical protein BH11ACT5_BH11ACT5_19460 [soil metagenome]